MVAGLVFAIVLFGASLSGAQQPPDCSWATNRPALSNAIYFGVTSPDDSLAWAVGYQRGSRGFERTLVRHWNGTEWTRQRSPNVEDQANRLYDVAVAADQTLWAVGERSRTVGKTIVQHYDGTRWRMQSSLNPSKTLNVLEGVDVTPEGTVYAAGSRWNRRRQYVTMVHRHNGTRWKLLPGGRLGMLHDVDALADTDVWAVGVKTADRVGRSYAAHYDGERWTDMIAPSVGDGFNVLHGVSATAPDDVWAAGSYREDGQSRPLILHYDGETWTVPDLSGFEGDTELLDIDAADNRTVVAVGQRYDAASEQDSRVILEWDGQTWKDATQDDDRQSNHLYAVDLAADGEGWAVGYNSSRSGSSYAERRTCS